MAVAAGARSQLTPLIGAVAIALLLVFAPACCATFLPMLAAIVITAAIGLIDVAAVRRLYQVRSSEFVLWLAAFVGWPCSCWSASSWPSCCRWPTSSAGPGVPTTPSWACEDELKGYHDIDRHPSARLIPGLLLYRFDAPLFFANAGYFRRRVRQLVTEATHPVRWAVVAAEPITDIDSTAADTLHELLEELRQDHVTSPSPSSRARSRTAPALRPVRRRRRRPASSPSTWVGTSFGPTWPGRRHRHRPPTGGTAACSTPDAPRGTRSSPRRTDLEGRPAGWRLIGRLAGLFAETRPSCCRRWPWRQARSRPTSPGSSWAWPMRDGGRAVAQVAGMPGEQVLAAARDVGDLGWPPRAARLAGPRPSGHPGGRGRVRRPAPGRPGPGEGSQGRKLAGLVDLLGQATPWRRATCCALSPASCAWGRHRHHPGRHRRGPRRRRKQPSILERAYNICSTCRWSRPPWSAGPGGGRGDGGAGRQPGAADARPAPQRARRDPGQAGGTCAAEYKYDGIRVQAHRTSDGLLELYTRRLDRVSTQFPSWWSCSARPWAARGDPGGRGGRLRPGLGGAAPVPGRDVPPPQVRHHRGGARLPSACSASSCCTPTAPT